MSNANAQSILDEMNEIAELEAMAQRLKELKAKNKNRLRVKVSQKGAVSVYGLQARFPVTLYAAQWEKLLLELVDTGVLRAFIEENKDQLSYKESK
tara:strand:+ start:4668 stop:4955 length:288 start_codon:yes stop_codon:yes gene_type:complete